MRQLTQGLVSQITINRQDSQCFVLNGSPELLIKDATTQAVCALDFSLRRGALADPYTGRCRPLSSARRRFQMSYFRTVTRPSPTFPRERTFDTGSARVQTSRIWELGDIAAGPTRRCALRLLLKVGSHAVLMAVSRMRSTGPGPGGPSCMQ